MVKLSTKIKDIHFKLHCDKKYASIFIEIQHKNEDIRKLYFNQFKQLKKPFIQYLGASQSWEKEYKNEIGFNYIRIIRKKTTLVYMTRILGQKYLNFTNLTY